MRTRLATMPGRREGYNYDESLGHDLTGDAGESVARIDVPGSPYISWQIDGDGDTADYEVQVSANESKWYTTDKTYSATDHEDDGGIFGERYIRIVRTSSEAGGTADVLLSAKR